MRPDGARRLIVLVNLLCLYMVVGSFAWLMSALCDRRGKAMTIAFVAVLASFLLNYLTPFWTVAEKCSFLSVLTYYQPLFILRDGVWPWTDMAILVTISVVLWSAAGAVFARRDLCTV